MRADRPTHTWTARDYQTLEMRRRKNISYFQLDKNKCFSSPKKTIADCRLDQEFMRSRGQKISNSILCHLVNQRFMLRKAATWNDIKFSKIEDRGAMPKNA